MGGACNQVGGNTGHDWRGGTQATSWRIHRSFLGAALVKAVGSRGHTTHKDMCAQWRGCTIGLRMLREPGDGQCGWGRYWGMCRIKAAHKIWATQKRKQSITASSQKIYYLSSQKRFLSSFVERLSSCSNLMVLPRTAQHSTEWPRDPKPTNRSSLGFLPME